MTRGTMAAQVTEGESLQFALDDIKDYAIFMVDLEGRIASWNAGAERSKGYSAQEIVGKPFSILFAPEDIQSGQPAREMRLALERGVYMGEGVRVRKDGSRFDAEVTLRLLLDDAGQPRGFVKVTRDITERKRAQEAERKRIEFEKELIGIVSHDLRNPLNAILLSATQLLRRQEMDALQARGLVRIVSSAERAARLIGDLLDFTQARLGDGLAIHRRPTDLQGLALQVVEEVRLSNPGREVQMEHSGDGTGNWDMDRIAQLLVNLLSNALKYGASDRPVRLITRGDADGSVDIEVHNWGEPIPPGELPYLFERLSRGPSVTGKPQGGIGLGLFIANQVVRAHEGTIQVFSSRENGTTFTVRLPRQAS
ncbi:PAS domain-containing sensor histidine kinase [Myxococcus xanthus]|uniref:histidine kinase n=2 Tax=Myxococcaceae TaxID=31 RepID=A0AAE6G0C2_MYXXA|nr:PAS domain-containing sensor histidine kinase [Myxococcus xanthus]QDE68324.1 hypothetical protein BHS09_15800 [Myxococcus xanthus]QDE75601.1 hypothetical protein BHS08_15815 [Myxococcus xanthus]QDE82928.1 hypothetical protein BHS07_15975 [Myxococcus xanthus]